MDCPQHTPATYTVTTSGLAIVFTYTGSTSNGAFKAGLVSVTNNGTGNVAWDATGGLSVIATTSASYIIASGKTLNYNIIRSGSFFSGFSAMTTASGSQAITVFAIGV